MSIDAYEKCMSVFLISVRKRKDQKTIDEPSFLDAGMIYFSRQWLFAALFKSHDPSLNFYI
jgi:hypothetical protein